MTGMLSVAQANAQLTSLVFKPQSAGNKAVVKLELSNHFSERIESARAAVFLLDQDGKMVGQATRWVIGGKPDQKGLAPGATNYFNFVIVADSPFTTTNLTPKISFNRVVLEGGKLADVARQVSVKTATK
jgi:hypothetical protein